MKRAAKFLEPKAIALEVGDLVTFSKIRGPNGPRGTYRIVDKLPRKRNPKRRQSP